MRFTHTFYCPAHGVFTMDAPKGCPVFAHCVECARRIQATSLTLGSSLGVSLKHLTCDCVPPQGPPEE